jgi:pimeloyl-ACP methyl ester carboxylesterase
LLLAADGFSNEGDPFFHRGKDTIYQKPASLPNMTPMLKYVTILASDFYWRIFRHQMSIMKRLFTLCLLVFFGGFTAMAQPAFEGSWEGALNIQGMQLPLVVHLNNTKTGYVGKFDSPKQKAYDIPLTSVQVQSDTLIFTVSNAQIRYQGMWVTGDSIVGTFTQAGRQLPMNLKRQIAGKGTAQVATVVRSQTPAKPYPYQTKEVKVKNKNAQLQLAATLSMPAGKGPFPAAILISGSGPQNRNSEVFDHEPFLVLSDFLTRQGIAVLRYDDRGVASSTGDFNTATSADFATDAAAAYDFLAKTKGIDKQKIGFIGHSEGGMIAPLAYGLRPNAGFMVLLAGVGIPVDALLLEQLQAVGTTEGLTQTTIDSQLLINKSIFGWLKHLPVEQAKDSIEALFVTALNRLPIGDVEARQQLELQQQSTLKTYTDPWFLYFIRYEPAPVLSQVKCPVLALNGDKDVQVIAESNLAGIETALQKGGNTQVQVEALVGLNHLFQPSKTGAVSEYAEIDITFDTAAMQKIGNWILKLK